MVPDTVIEYDEDDDDKPLKKRSKPLDNDTEDSAMFEADIINVSCYNQK